MSKSVLVIDTPPCCEDCPCMNWASYEDEILCGALGEELFVNDKEEVIKSKRCPLKSMPQKEERTEVSGGLNWDNAFNCGYVVGWNACLEEIEE